MSSRCRPYLMAVAALYAATALAQDEVRSSSSLYLPAFTKADVTVAFDVNAEGKTFEPIWGLDQAWISEQNLKKGVNHMLKENVGIGRTAFRFTKPLVNDSALAADQVNALQRRTNIFNQVSNTLPLVFTADQEAGTDEYYVKNNAAINDHWAAMINSHVHWMQAKTKHPIVGISPFNEGDYWTKEEGGTAVKQWQVAKLLKEQYPRCADIAMVGGNTLNNDKALSWYTPGKQYYDWGNTHQLAGSFDTFAKFFQQVARDGKVGYADEMHNVGEAMVGLEYGMTVGIWWGFDSRARGEFCQISRHGQRLAYGEHRDNWTAASVYRHDDGRVKAFVGSSERQAVTTNYQLVSTTRDVYYDGYGPVREYLTVMPGGTGYQKGQTNAERVIDITWGEDVAPGVLDGTYKIVNKKSGNVLSYSSNGNNIIQQRFIATNKKQQWTVKPCTNRTGGDLSFYDIESVADNNMRINAKDYATTTGDLIAWTQTLPTSNEQWYVEYVGDGYYYIRNRESALYMAAYADGATARLIQTTMLPEANRDRMLFRFLPVEVNYETTAPAQPTGLTAEAHAASVTLKWETNADADLEGYMVLRAPQGTDQWNTIARKLPVNTFTDNTCQPGTSYIYKVKAIDLAQNLSEASAVVEATPTAESSTIGHWLMEGNTHDATANMMDGAFCGNVVYVDDCKEGIKALRLNSSSSQYVQLPYEVAGSDELTVALWIKWRSGTSTWQRIFDFGNDTEHYMFLTPNNAETNVMRFAIKNGSDEQTVDCKTRLQAQQWKHVAVSIGKGQTVIYVDGEAVGSSTGITIRPSDIRPVLNYLGRSQFASDPFLMADLDDVRILNYAVGADDVKAMMDGTDPVAVRTPSVVGQPAVTYGLDGIRRTAPRRGLNVIDGKKVIR